MSPMQTQSADDVDEAAAATVAKKPAQESFLARYGLLVVFVITIVVFSALKPDIFPTWENAKAILTAAAPMLIVAAGLTVVVVMQEFDLSFGALIGLASGAAVTLMTQHGANWVLAVVIAVLIGVAGGLLNGFIVSYLGGPSLIITLAMMTVFTGVEYAITDQRTVFSGLDPSYLEIGQGDVLGINNQVWIAAVFGLLAWTLLEKTEAGRFMYATGSNREATRMAGIDTRKLVLAGFVIMGVAAAAVGILLSSQSSSYAPNSGAAYLLPAFAAVFLGSAAFRPGSFNLPGTVLGVLLLGVIQTGLTQLNLQSFLISLIQGGVLIVAVLSGRLGARRAT